MHREFELFVNNLEASSKWVNLPLAHTFLLQSVSNILKNRKLILSQCDVFNKNLLYCFYGKPNYRSFYGEKASTNTAFYPICIIINNKSIVESKIYKVFPFDSGAFHLGLYKKIFDNDLELDDYSLPRNITSIDKFLTFYFDNYYDYYIGERKQIKALPSTLLQVNDIYNLYGATGEQDFDDRAKTVEMIFSKEIKLTDENIELIICPTSLMVHFEKVFKNIKIQPYDPKRLSRSSDFYSIIEQYSLDFLRENYGECFNGQ